MNWAHRLVQRDSLENNLEKELRFHIEQHANELIGRGFEPGEARRQAKLAFGGVEGAKEDCRDARGTRWLEELVQDAGFAARTMRKNPGFALAAILALALGIGANTALFSALYGVLLRPLPFAAGERLVELHQVSSGVNGGEVYFSAKEVGDYRERTHSYEQIEEYFDFPYLVNAPHPDRVRAGVVSPGFFRLLGVAPVIGRDLEPSDDVPGAPPVILLTYEYWRRTFAADPAIAGTTVKMNEQLYTIIGVLPSFPQFTAYGRENQLYMPSASSPQRMNAAFREGRTRRRMRLFGRLRPGATPASATSEMNGILAALHREYPADYKDDAGVKAAVKSVRSEMAEGTRSMLTLLLATTGIVLLLCCSNVANLFLARLLRREQEFSLRTALGASRGRLMRQVLTESGVLALGGGVLGLLLADATFGALARYLIRFTPRAKDISLQWPVLLFALAVSLGTGVLFGLLPALTAGRGKGSLQVSSYRASATRAKQRARAALIAAQIAACFVLLSGAGVMLRTLINVERVHAGFDAEDVVSMSLSYNYAKLGESADPDGHKLRAYEEQIIERVRQLPGVTAAGILSIVPLRQTTPYDADFVIEGSAPNTALPLRANAVNASPGVFPALGVRLLRGRLLNDADGKDHPAAVITESMARHFFPGQDPVGHRLRGDGSQMGLPAVWMPVVGVVDDVHMFGLDKDAPDTIYMPTAMEPRNGFQLVMRCTANPTTTAEEARRAIQSLDPELPVTDVKTLLELKGESLLTTRVIATLLAVFAGLALAIAATGLAGVTAFLVGQRTREIGIRIALGATARQVLLLVLSYSAKLVIIGAVVGLGVSIATGKLLQKFLFGVRPVDWLSLALVALVLGGTALFASYLPARKAATVDPLLALRCD